MGCKCIAEVDKLLAARGESLVTGLSLKGAPPRVIVATMPYTAPVRGRAKVGTYLQANFCPFCGVLYTDPPKPKRQARARKEG
jgi:hypothetical protein